MKDLFVYGTLMNEEVLSLILKSRVARTDAELVGFSCLMVAGEWYPAIRPDVNGVVNGKIIDDLSSLELGEIGRAHV